LGRLVELQTLGTGHRNGALALADEESIRIGVRNHVAIPLTSAFALTGAGGARWSLDLSGAIGGGGTVHIPPVIAIVYRRVEVQTGGTLEFLGTTIVALDEPHADPGHIYIGASFLINAIRAGTFAIRGHHTWTRRRGVGGVVGVIEIRCSIRRIRGIGGFRG